VVIINIICYYRIYYNLLDKRKSNLKFSYEELPHLQPVRIATKGKGFWKGIIMWLMSTRNWVIIKDLEIQNQ
jgi:hypothetical protein